MKERPDHMWSGRFLLVARRNRREALENDEKVAQKTFRMIGVLLGGNENALERRHCEEPALGLPHSPNEVERLIQHDASLTLRLDTEGVFCELAKRVDVGFFMREFLLIHSSSVPTMRKCIVFPKRIMPENINLSINRIDPKPTSL